jgi:hypothetical protein
MEIPAVIVVLQNENTQLNKKNIELCNKINELERYIKRYMRKNDLDICCKCGHICLELQIDYTKCDMCLEQYHMTCGLKSVCKLCLKMDCKHKIKCKYKNCGLSKNTYMTSCSKAHKTLCYLHVPVSCECEGVSIDLCNSCYDIFLSSDNPLLLIPHEFDYLKKQKEK